LNVGRGFFSGVFWGLVVSVVTVAVGSLMQGGARINPVAPAASAVSVPAGTPFDQGKPEETTRIPQMAPAVTEDPAPASPSPAVPDQAPETVISTPAGVPAIATPDTGVALTMRPPEGETATMPVAVAPAADDPETGTVPVAAPTVAPAAPQGETLVDTPVETLPENPGAPEPAVVAVAPDIPASPEMTAGG
jgi:hypothetical protein